MATGQTPTDSSTKFSYCSSASSSPSPQGNIDYILREVVKPFGRWQFIILMITVWSDIPAAIFPIFGNSEPSQYRCRMEPHIEQMLLANRSLQFQYTPGFTSPKGPSEMMGHVYGHSFKTIAEAIGPIGNETGSPGCLRFKRDYSQVHTFEDLLSTPKSSPKEPCPHGYVYESNKYKYPSGIVIEWDLVCDREWLPSISSSLYMLGMVPGFWMGGFLADSRGRRPTALWFLLFQIITGFLCSFAPNFVFYAVCRFFLGFLTVGRSNVLLVLPVELTTSRYRFVVASTTCLVQSFLNRALVSLCAYFVPYWRWLHIITVAPLFIGISHIWLLPESPRWLISKERYEEAATVLFDGYLTNQRGWFCRKRSNEPQLTLADFRDYFCQEDMQLKCREDFSAGSVKSKGFCRTFLDDVRSPFRTAYLARVSFIATFLFTAQTACLYGVLLYARVVRGYVYLVSFLNSLTGIPGAILSSILYYYIRHRKHPLMVTYICTFVCLITGGLYAWLTPGDDDLVLTICSNLALVLSTTITNMLFTYVPELYPSCIRSQGLGTAAGLGRIGAALGAFINELDGALVHGVPLMFYSGLILFALLALIFLPDTTGDNLLDKLDEDNATSNSDNSCEK